MLIRPETPADRATVASVHAAACTGPHPDAVARAFDALRRSGDLIGPLSMVAEVDGAVVGHVVAARGTPDGLVAVGPLSVLPAHRGVGVGSGLLHSVVAAAEALWYVGLVALGDAAWYGRFGFVPAQAHGLEDADAPVVGSDDTSAAACAGTTGVLLVRPLPSSWAGGYAPGTVFRRPAALGPQT